MAAMNNHVMLLGFILEIWNVHCCCSVQSIVILHTCRPATLEIFYFLAWRYSRGASPPWSFAAAVLPLRWSCAPGEVFLFHSICSSYRTKMTYRDEDTLCLICLRDSHNVAASKMNHSRVLDNASLLKTTLWERALSCSEDLTVKVQSGMENVCLPWCPRLLLRLSILLFFWSLSSIRSEIESDPEEDQGCLP